MSSSNQSFVPTYAPSWVDRLNARIDRLPGPYWAFAVGMGIVLFSLIAFVFTREGNSLTANVVTYLELAFAVPYPLALIHFLDRRSREALHAMRSVMTVNDAEYDQLTYQLTTMPALPTFLLTLLLPLLGILVFFSLPGLFLLTRFSGSGVAYGLNIAIIVVIFPLMGVLIYHTLRQLRWVSHIYNHAVRVDLFDLGPLYAFSGLTARTALGLLGLAYVQLTVSAEWVLTPVGFVRLVPFGTLVILTFALPLLGIHQRLVGEKVRMLRETSKRIAETIHLLHERVDAKQFVGMDDMNKTIASLEIEQRMLEKIPTWPWQPDTLRLLLTALIIPIALFVLQFILPRMLAP